MRIRCQKNQMFSSKTVNPTVWKNKVLTGGVGTGHLSTEHNTKCGVRR
jgi:hypothetical protein